MKKGAESFTWTSLGGVGAQDMVFRRFAAANGVDVAKTRAIALKGGAEAVTMTRRRACAARHRHVERHCRPAQRRQAARAGGRRSRALARSSTRRRPRKPAYPTSRCRSGSASPAHPGLPADIVATWDAALKDVLADKSVQEKMINAGVVASYQDSKDMTARVEQDRKLTQTLFGH